MKRNVRSPRGGGIFLTYTVSQAREEWGRSRGLDQMLWGRGYVISITAYNATRTSWGRRRGRMPNRKFWLRGHLGLEDLYIRAVCWSPFELSSYGNTFSYPPPHHIHVERHFIAKYGIVMFSCTVGLLFVIVWISSWWRYVLSETMFVCVDRIHQEGHGWPVGEISRWIHPPFPPITLIALDNLREQNQSTVPHVFFKATPLPITWRTS